jgi:hypothetical protein
MPDSIVLLGAWGAGKSTVGRLLGESLQMPVCDLPTKAGEYREAAGYDSGKLSQQEGIEAILRYLLPFEVLTLERGLRDHPHSVIEAGALQTAQDQPELALRFKAALVRFANVVLLQPTPDIDESSGYCMSAAQNTAWMAWRQLSIFSGIVPITLSPNRSSTRRTRPRRSPVRRYLRV